MIEVDPTRVDMYGDDRVRGVTNHGLIEFDCPLVSFIDKNLWQGGCFNGTRLNPVFQHIISLYPWERYKLSRARMDTELYITMLDSEDQAMDQVDAIAGLVNECRKTGPVLVHCQAGLNRSSLIAARALFLDGAFDTGDEIVTYLRAARSPAVLCNPAFEAEVRSWEHHKVWTAVEQREQYRCGPDLYVNGKPRVYYTEGAAREWVPRHSLSARIVELDFSDKTVSGRYV